MGEERVSIAVADHVADVRLARGERHNALDLPAFTALIEAAERVREDRSIRAVVLSGDGPSFCSGLDTKSFAVDWPHSVEVLLRRDNGAGLTPAQRAALAWTEVRAPVIAAIHGACVGGGLQIALAADLRIASHDARLAVMEVRLGLIPDMGASRTLVAAVGLDVAKELTFTGRIVGGSEAVRLGLVTRVAADPRGAARALASEIASRSPDAIRAAKQLYEQSWNAEPKVGLQLEGDFQCALIKSANQLEALRAATAGDVPQFTDAVE